MTKSQVEKVVVPYASIDLTNDQPHVSVVLADLEGKTVVGITDNLVIKSDPEGVALRDLIGQLQVALHQIQRTNVERAVPTSRGLEL